MSEGSRTYPRRVDIGGISADIRPMTAADGDDLKRLVAEQAPHDLLFLRRDISQPKVQEAWIRAVEAGTLSSLVARQGDKMVGCTAIYNEPLTWSRHVGELRVLLSPDMRGKGLGRVLIEECFAQALSLGLKKLMAQMTTDQRSAIAVFEELGFKAEALLSKHVIDRDGKLHDLVLLSHDVNAMAAQNDLYGLTEALGGSPN